MNSEKLDTISFSEIVNGRDSTVRITSDKKIFAIDLVMVITGKNQNNAAWTLHCIPNNVFDASNIEERKTPGKGNSKTKLITFNHAIKLIMVLPGNIAKEIRTQFANVIHRYMAGDASLVGEIKANAESGSAVNQLARESLDMQEKIEDNHSKKRRLELEDLEIMERREALEALREERELTREERELKREEREAKREERESKRAFLPLQLMENCSNIVEKFGGWEARDLVMNKAILANYMHTFSKNYTGASAGYPIDEGLKQIAPPEIQQPEIPQYISIPMVVSSMKIKGNLNYLRIGKIASDLFLEKHGKRPGEYYGKHNEINAQGVMVTANDYRKEDEPILRQAVENYLKEIEKMEDKKPADGFKQQRLDFKKKPASKPADIPNYDTENDSIYNAGLDDEN